MPTVESLVAPLPVVVRRLDRRRAAPLIAILTRGLSARSPAAAVRRRIREIECIGAMDGRRIVGNALFRPRPNRLELLHIHVFEEVRRRRVGSELIEHLVGRLSGEQTRIWLLVRERNVAAQCFFRACGFEAPADGVWRQAFGEEEDAFVMIRRLRTRTSRGPQAEGSGPYADLDSSR